MKALIRNTGEIVLESMNIPCIDWTTGAPLTDPDWFGGPYQLVDNYIEVADGAIYDVAVYPESEDPADDFDPAPARCKAKGAVQAPPAQAPVVKVNPDAPVPVGDTIVIDGVTYTRTS